MRRVKLEEILQSGSCYSEDRIRELVGKRKSISLKNLLDMDIPDTDKIWAFANLNFVDDRDKRLFACACAESVLHLYECKYPGDNRPRQAIEVARRYSSGEATTEELQAARSAARSAADWAARSAADSVADWAADSAAYSAARSAARSAADWAARSAADSVADWAARSAADSVADWAADWAARSAAYSAAYSAAATKQVALIRRFLQTGQWDRLAGGEE